MENAMSTVGVALSHQQPAVQNGSVAAARIKLMIIWLVVGLPLLWGAIKALENIGSLPL